MIFIFLVLLVISFGCKSLVSAIVITTKVLQTFELWLKEPGQLLRSPLLPNLLMSLV